MLGADRARLELFGSEALELDPLAIPLPDSRASLEPLVRLPPPPGRCAFSLSSGPAAGAILEDLCARLASASLAPDLRSLVAGDRPAAATRPRRLLLCDRPELERLGADSATARLLLACAAALEEPPPAPLLMGILNVTPDSFSDGGRYLDPAPAVEHGLRMAAEGADWIDVGGESTRPGAAPVPAAEQCRRVLPVVAELARTWGGAISIDTRLAEVARAALDAGAAMVNDVSAGREDPGMLALVAARGCRICLMHMRGAPATMQAEPTYDDVVGEVSCFLRGRVRACLNEGIELPRIWIDPGIGFGKRLEHNLELLRRLSELRSLSLPVLLGVSRKSFIAHVTGTQRPEDWKAAGQAAVGSSPPDAAARPARAVPSEGTARPRSSDRSGGTAAAVAAAARAGVDVLRVHDVAVMREAAAVARAIAGLERSDAGAPRSPRAAGEWPQTVTETAPPQQRTRP